MFRRAGAFLALGVIAAGSCLPSAAVAEPPWWEGLVLIELQPGADPVRAQQAVEATGGRIALLLPGGLVGWIPPGLELQVSAHPDVAGVHRDADHLAPNQDNEIGARFFERALRGDFAPTQAPPFDTRFATDAFDPGPISAGAVRRSVAGIEPQLSKSVALQAAGAPPPMLGRVAVTLFFVESDGSGSDPNQFDWIRSAEDEVIDAALAGLTWWSDQARQNGVSVAFQLQVYRATSDSRCRQWREPILHASTEVAGVVTDVLARFGYTSGDHLARAAAHNSVQRAKVGADAAFSSFVVANPSGADAYTDGRAAWAYTGGPYTALLQRNHSWSFDRVFTHESAHVFGACDEYWEAGIGGCSSCEDCGDTGVDNGNCEDCNPAAVSCMMRRNSWALCEYTPGQIGWWRDMHVHYVGLAGDPRLPFRTPSTAAHDIDDALAIASPGDTIRLTTTPIVRTLPLRIDKTLVVEGGWNEAFSARTPQTPTAIDTRGAGPVIFVDQPQATVVLDALHLRNGAGTLCAPPELGNVLAGGGLLCWGARAVLRDCVLESNVAGTASTPGAGGGAFFWNADVVLERVTVRGNTAGRGGGVGFVSSRATLSQCSIRDNRLGAGALGTTGSAHGAGIDAIASVLELQDTQVRENAGAVAGGGIHVQRSQLDLVDVQLSGNQAGESGGGLAADASDVRLRGCAVQANSANTGGGVHASGGSLLVESTWIAGNHATAVGGAAFLVRNAPRLTNVTVALNEAPGAGGLMLIDERPGAMVRNSIVAYNTHGGLVHSTPGLLLEWNDLWANDTGDTPLDVGGSDPRFVSLPTLDLELGMHSPCIDTGDPLLTDADGSRSDLGAFGGAWAHRGAPARMLDVTAAMAADGARICWDRVPEGTDSVLVYRGSAPAFPPSETTFVALIAAARAEYVDAGATPGSWYKLAPRSPSGAVGGYSEPVRAAPTTDVGTYRPRHELLPVSPNPANPGAWVAFQLAAATPVRVAIHDARGRRTRLLLLSDLGPGLHRMFWDGRDDRGEPAASGVYWVHLDAASTSRIRRFVVVR
jgi:hypothetical protein